MQHISVSVIVETTHSYDLQVLYLKIFSQRSRDIRLLTYVGRLLGMRIH